MAALKDLEIRLLTAEHLDWAMAQVADQFASSRVVSKGVLHDCRDLPGVVCLSEGQPCGLLQFSLVEGELEVVILIATLSGLGVGSQLLGAANTVARELEAKRIWLITTNNNLEAIEFYERVGYKLVRVHKGAVTKARKLKPEIPAVDGAGRPISDELEVELRPPFPV